MEEKIHYLSAVLLVSENPKRLAEFYRDVIGVPLEDEAHGESEPHFGCELGDLHFAIHPPANFGGKTPGVGSVRLAFTVFDINALLARLKAKGVEPVAPPADRGFAILATVRDPDGNEIEFTQLSDRWFSHLEERRKKGFDVIVARKSR